MISFAMNQPWLTGNSKHLCGERVVNDHERSLLEQLTVQVATLTVKMDQLLKQREILTHYSAKQFADEVGKAVDTVEGWCRNGRIVASRKNHGRGGNREWVIERSEIERYRREGLLPMASNFVRSRQ